MDLEDIHSLFTRFHCIALSNIPFAPSLVSPQ